MTDAIDIYLHGSKLDSVFELLGTKENDITYSLGWALSHSPTLLDGLLSKIFPSSSIGDVDRIELQQHDADGGYTDVEIIGPNLHVIIEAKRGWTVPGKVQLQKYSRRLKKSEERKFRALVSMSECSSEYVDQYPVKNVGGFRVIHISWKDIDSLCNAKPSNHAEKRLLQQLRTYMRRIVSMQRVESNLVYVVSLGAEIPEFSKISSQAFVEEKGIYFHPVGGKGGWPKEPPNYVGFRYRGELQSIHHVDDWEIVTNLHKVIPEIRNRKHEPRFVYKLGMPITPTKTVKTGKLYSSLRVWAMLDLLLTCDTIAEARDKTKVRQGEEA